MVEAMLISVSTDSLLEAEQVYDPFTEVQVHY